MKEVPENLVNEAAGYLERQGLLPRKGHLFVSPFDPSYNGEKWRLFFTDPSGPMDNVFVLVGPADYGKIPGRSRAVFKDPGVDRLIGKCLTRYPDEDKLLELVPKVKGVYRFISVDYPPGAAVVIGRKAGWKEDRIFRVARRFAADTDRYNLRFADHPGYILCLQTFADPLFGSPERRFTMFKRTFRINMPILLSNPDKVVAIGGIKSIRNPDKFTDLVFGYIVKHAEVYGIKWLHIYGASLRIIRKYLPYLSSKIPVVSVDNTKWTRAVNDLLVFAQKGRISARNRFRKFFLDQYIRRIISDTGLEVVYR